MKQLDLTVFEPGETVGTLSKDGKVALWTVGPEGGLTRADHRLFGNADGLVPDSPIEELNLTVKTYNLLKRNSVDTVGELLDYYHEKGDLGLSEIRNMGEKNIAEIRDWVIKIRAANPEPS